MPCVSYLNLGCRATAAVAPDLGRWRLLRRSARLQPLVHFDILTGRAVPREVNAHAVLLESRPNLLVGVRGERGAQRVEKRARMILGKQEAGALAVARIERTHRINEATYRADHRYRGVPLAVHLVQPARLEARRHHEDVAATLHEMRAPLVKADECADAVGIGV